MTFTTTLCACCCKRTGFEALHDQLRAEVRHDADAVEQQHRRADEVGARLQPDVINL